VLLQLANRRELAMNRIWRYRRALLARLDWQRSRVESQSRSAMREWLMV